MTAFSIEWIDRGREPQCAPDPEFPSGKDVNIAAEGQVSCKTTLPYPAKRCGLYVVRCTTCGMSVSITTAGRPDDPRSLTIPCKPMASA